MSPFHSHPAHYTLFHCALSTFLIPYSSSKDLNLGYLFKSVKVFHYSVIESKCPISRTVIILAEFISTFLTLDYLPVNPELSLW